MEKIFIKNQKNQNIVVIIERAENQVGLAFVMHGLGGSKDQAHIETFAKAFSNNNYSVVRFDTTNTFGESDGNYEDATTTNYYEDLEDVINWSKNQDWYQKPFALCGHSLGGICTALYAENNPDEVKALAPISTVVNGELSWKTRTEEELKNWKETGWQIRQSFSGITKKLKWSHMEDRLKFDLLKKVEKLTMPVIMIVGDMDDETPLDQQKILFDKLPGRKELHIIKGAPHTFRDPNHLEEIYQLMNKWIVII